MPLNFPGPANLTDAAGVSATPCQEGPTRLRILMVDNDRLLIKSLRDTLETDGHQIVNANTGEGGIASQRLVAEGDVPPHEDRVLSKPPKWREWREAMAHCLTLAKN